MQSSTPSADTVLRIGTRGSPLALVQAGQVRARLAAAHGLAPERIDIEIIRTSGDMIRDRPLSEVGGKGLFTKEIEDALLAGRVDLAVHSAKDMPTVLPAGLAIVAVLPREDPRDAFISRRSRTLQVSQFDGVGRQGRRRAIVGPGLFRPAIQISRLEIAIDERCLGHGACKQRSSQCQAPCLGSGLLFESTPLGTDSLSCHTAPLFFDAFAPLKKLCSATVDSPAAFPRSKKERTNPLRGL